MKPNLKNSSRNDRRITKKTNTASAELYFTISLTPFASIFFRMRLKAL